MLQIYPSHFEKALNKKPPHPSNKKEEPLQWGVFHIVVRVKYIEINEHFFLKNFEVKFNYRCQFKSVRKVKNN